MAYLIVQKILRILHIILSKGSVKMLSVWFSDSPLDVPFDNYISQPDPWFDNQGGEEFITGNLEREMIKAIDKSEVISNNAIESSVLGTIPPTYLSGTVKTLILINNIPGQIFNGSSMGNLAAPWLLKIADQKDISIRLGYIMKFKEPLKIKILNSNTIVNSYQEYIDAAFEYLS